jgi:hypothetical protein
MTDDNGERGALDPQEAVPGSAPVDPLALLARGDRKGAITALMDQHGAAVFNFCSRFLLDRALAEDVLQQVFLHAHRDIERFEGRSSPSTAARMRSSRAIASASPTTPTPSATPWIRAGSQPITSRARA